MPRLNQRLLASGSVGIFELSIRFHKKQKTMAGLQIHSDLSVKERSSPECEKGMGKVNIRFSFIKRIFLCKCHAYDSTCQSPSGAQWPLCLQSKSKRSAAAVLKSCDHNFSSSCNVGFVSMNGAKEWKMRGVYEL